MLVVALRAVWTSKNEASTEKQRMRGSEAAAVARSKSTRREGGGASGLGVFSFDLQKAR
jgi:hypothetical protein